MALSAADRRLIDSLVVEDRSRGTFRVSRRVFADPDIFAMERELVYDRVWLYIGHASEIAQPGTFVTRSVNGRALILVRDRRGTVRALYNSCPHRGAVICKEHAGTARVFRCSYHGWVFDTAGKLADIPVSDAMFPGYESDPLLNMREVARCEEYRGFIFVSFDPNVASLDDYLAEAKTFLSYIADQGEDGMEVVDGAEEYCIEANWKFMQENSVDGYHAMATHSTYIEYSIARDGPKPNFNPAQNYGRVEQLGNGHSVSWSVGSTPWGRPYARWTPAWGEEARLEIEEIERRIVLRVGPERARIICHSDRNMTIFPNLAVHDIMGITIRNLMPTTHRAHDIVSRALAPVNESDSSRLRRMRNYVEFLGPAGLATPDDVEMLEMCQQGIENNLDYSWNDVSRGMCKDPDQQTKLDEAQMRTFWRRWKQLMTGSELEVVGA